MPRTHAYGLLDLFALVEKLLAPFVDPLRAEFAVKAVDRPRPTPPPAEVTPTPAEPTAAPAAEPTPEVPVSVPVVVYSAAVVVPAEAEFSASEPERSATGPVRGVTKMVDERSPAEPLFVRRGAGRGARYDVAPPDATGQRYRVVVRGGRRKFICLEADR